MLSTSVFCQFAEVCALREQETVCICVCGFVRDLRVCLVLSLCLSLYSGNTEDQPVKDQSFAHQSLASLGHSNECSLSVGNKQTLDRSLASSALSVPGLRPLLTLKVVKTTLQCMALKIVQCGFHNLQGTLHFPVHASTEGQNTHKAVAVVVKTIRYKDHQIQITS